MKTIAKTLLAAVAVAAGSNAAEAGFNESYAQSPAGFCATPTQAVWRDGSYAGAACRECGCTDATCDCAFGECNHLAGTTAACATGNCNHVGAYPARSTAPASHVYRPTAPRSMSTYPVATHPYGTGVTQPYYTGTSYTGTTQCPGGVCPQVPATTHMTGYRPLPAANGANCANGVCRPMPYTQPRAQAPRFNLLGLRW